MLRIRKHPLTCSFKDMTVCIYISFYNTRITIKGKILILSLGMIQNLADICFCKIFHCRHLSISDYFYSQVVKEKGCLHNLICQK